MPLPALLTNPVAIGIGSSIVGAIGSLFGGQKTDLPPQLKRAFDLLERQAEEGLSPEEEFALQQRLERRLSNEQLGITGAAESAITRQGGGVGVTGALAQEIAGQRFRAIGQGLSDITALDEQSKRSAVGQIGALSGSVGQFTRDTGEGFGQLLGFGLNTLLEGGRRRRQQEILDMLGGR